MIGYGKKKSKNKVNLTKTENSIKRVLKGRGALEDFVAPIFQKDSSDNYYLPERGIFTLPIRFVNLLYNYAYKESKKGEEISPTKALEHFLTHVVNAKEILSFIAQRPKHVDNQSRRLHNAVTWELHNTTGQKLSEAEKIAEKIIKEKKPELDALIQEAIRTGKKMYEYRRKAEVA